MIYDDQFAVDPIHIGSQSTISLNYIAAIYAAYPFMLTGRVLVDFKYSPADTVPVCTIDSAVSAADVVRVPITTGDYIGGLHLDLLLSPAKTVLLNKASIYFDVVAYNGAVPKLLPGQWNWPVARQITTPR